MNYKTLLLAGAAVLFTTQAMADDLTSAVYAPKEGQITSDTSVTYGREKMKHGWGAWDEVRAAETLAYGINDRFSVYGTIENMFDYDNDWGWSLNNSHNFDYTVGGKYTVRFCNKTTVQADAHYYTYNPKSWEGHKGWEWTRYGGRWYKVLGGSLTVAQEVADGLSVYGTYGLDSEIDQADRHIYQYAKVGLHKYTGKWAFDGGIRYDFNVDDDRWNDNWNFEGGKNTNEVWAEAAIDYYVRDNIALGVNGGYFLAGEGSSDVSYDYEAGAHVKVLF